MTLDDSWNPSTILVTGSRIYAPVSDVWKQLDTANSPNLTHVHAFGTSSASYAAIEWASRHDGITYKHSALSQNRSNLYEAADAEYVHTFLFACLAPKSKHLTKGIGEIIDYFMSDRMNGASFDVIRSPIPGRICEQITELRKHAQEYAAIADADPRSNDPSIRSRARMKQKHLDAALSAGVDLTYVAQRLYKKLEDEKGKIGDNGEGADEWIRALRTYELIEREKSDALALLG